jgi:ribA/ribD-fused uncharacterized protein
MDGDVFGFAVCSWHSARRIRLLIGATMSTEKFTHFWHGPFSQWHPSTFTVGKVTYSHAEQFMMYAKALLFGDHETGAKILLADNPREQKALGREVKNFDQAVWELFREGIVFTGSYAKFTQNADLLRELLATRGTTLVEASPRDTIWGIGLGAENPKASNRAQWRGLNLLGEALTRVRETVLQEIARGTREEP